MEWEANLHYFSSLNIEELNLLAKDYASDGYLLVNQFC